jgi:hypothetical protein
MAARIILLKQICLLSPFFLNFALFCLRHWLESPGRTELNVCSASQSLTASMRYFSDQVSVRQSLDWGGWLIVVISVMCVCVCVSSIVVTYVSWAEFSSQREEELGLRTLYIRLHVRGNYYMLLTIKGLLNFWRKAIKYWHTDAIQEKFWLSRMLDVIWS